MALAEPNEYLTLPEGSDFIYSAKGILGLFGTLSYSDAVPALSFTDPQSGITLTTTGWQGSAQLASDKMDYETRQAMSLEVSIMGNSIASFNNISVSADLESGLMQAWEQPLYNSVASFAIDTITIVDPASKEETNLSGIVMDSITSYDNTSELGDILVSTKVASFVNSAVAMQDIQFDFEMANLQASFFKAYQKLAEDMMNTPEQTESIVQAFMQDAALAQLKVNPEINLPVIKAIVNESKIDGYANTKLAGIQTLPDNLEDAKFWADHAVVDAKLAIEEDAALFIAELILKSQLAANPQFAVMSEEEQQALIAQQSLATINAFVQQGILSETEAGYEITFSMENAEALLNGQPVGLPL